MYCGCCVQGLQIAGEHGYCGCPFCPTTHNHYFVQSKNQNTVKTEGRTIYIHRVMATSSPFSRAASEELSNRGWRSSKAELQVVQLRHYDFLSFSVILLFSLTKGGETKIEIKGTAAGGIHDE